MFLPTDRSVQFPNRYQLAPVSGTDNIADLTPAPGEVSDPGTLWNRQAARQMQADLRTLPIASGHSVSAGDVVDVSGGEVVKTDESSTAIALQSGTAGQSIECIFSGTTNASFVTEGQVIDSPGVYGVGIMDGILQVWSEERPGRVVTGSYVGTGTYGQDNPNALTFDFTPKYVVISNNSLPAFTTSGMIYNKPNVSNNLGNVNSHINVSWNENNVSWYSPTNAGNQLNESGVAYYYFAIG